MSSRVCKGGNGVVQVLEVYCAGAYKGKLRVCFNKERRWGFSLDQGYLFRLLRNCPSKLLSVSCLVP